MRYLLRSLSPPACYRPLLLLPVRGLLCERLRRRVARDTLRALRAARIVSLLCFILIQFLLGLSGQFLQLRLI
jgi:hypothetical protein